jgi:hypothetical protein
MKTSILSFLLGASLLSATAQAQTNLGYHIFDYGMTQPLGSSVSIFEGALTLHARTDLTDYYTGAGSLTNGIAGSLYYEHDDAFVAGGVGSSTLGIRGDFGQISELTFDFNGGSARMDSINLVVNGLNFGASPYDILATPGYNLDEDDPMLWFNTNQGVLTFNEQQIQAATFFELDPAIYGAAANESGRIDFANLLQNGGFDLNTSVTSFGLRETNGMTFVSDIWVDSYTAAAAAAPVPEPGSVLLLGASSLLALRRRRPSRISSRLAVG